MKPRAETAMGLEVIGDLRVDSRFSIQENRRRIRAFRFPVGALPTGDNTWINKTVRKVIMNVVKEM